jgi:hypothetical protein
MLECLLSGEGDHLLSDINGYQLRNFRDTYGTSAFVCRYLHCSKATDGFDSLQQRDTHEAKHQRKFRCAHPFCAYFHSGFTTRSALKKHNQKYHGAVEDRGTLAQAIIVLKQRNAPRTRPSVNVQNLTVERVTKRCQTKIQTLGILNCRTQCVSFISTFLCWDLAQIGLISQNFDGPNTDKEYLIL